jgi:uncharacterized protein YbgA (DUF1722 family)/uncharacterized protein YbbK (DUF523 family)
MRSPIYSMPNEPLSLAKGHHLDTMSTTKISLGVSACLLGQAVRYDGGHKRDTFISGTLAEYMEYLPICPEMAIGLGVPRPPIRLVGDPLRPRARGIQDPTLDVTERLEQFAERTMPTLAHISGYLLKKDSPSCGMERVKVYGESGGTPVRKASGIFARVLQQHWPLLPIEEEGRLNDAVLRENFINRVFIFHSWQQLTAQRLTAKALLDFHTQHKYLAMAHSQAAYQRLGRLLSNLSKTDLEALGTAYITELMGTLKRRVTRQRHANVLQHLMGYLKKRIDGGDKAELLAHIAAYRRGEIPLIVPITMLKHYLRRHPDAYLQQQSYLSPHPEKLGLRNAL